MREEPARAEHRHGAAFEGQIRQRGDEDRAPTGVRLHAAGIHQPGGGKRDCVHAFAAEHGSWNRTRRTGYKVIRIPTEGGKATGEYIDFLTGFVTPAGDVWGRPVGVTVAKDGALLVSDDTGDCIWRVSFTGKK